MGAIFACTRLYYHIAIFRSAAKLLFKNFDGESKEKSKFSSLQFFNECHFFQRFLHYNRAKALFFERVVRSDVVVKIEFRSPQQKSQMPALNFVQKRRKLVVFNAANQSQIHAPFYRGNQVDGFAQRHQKGIAHLRERAQNHVAHFGEFIIGNFTANLSLEFANIFSKRSDSRKLIDFVSAHGLARRNLVETAE